MPAYVTSLISDTLPLRGGVNIVCGFTKSSADAAISCQCNSYSLNVYQGLLATAIAVADHKSRLFLAEILFLVKIHSLLQVIK